MKPLDEYCRYLGWNAKDLARNAGINQKTARKALAGELVAAKVARSIAEAISKATGEQVHVGDISGLNFR